MDVMKSYLIGRHFESSLDCHWTVHAMNMCLIGHRMGTANVHNFTGPSNYANFTRGGLKVTQQRTRCGNYSFQSMHVSVSSE